VWTLPRSSFAVTSFGRIHTLFLLMLSTITVLY
jgi:hypothetical protein